MENFQIIFEFSDLFQNVTATLTFTMDEVTVRRSQHQDAACGVTSMMETNVTTPDPAVMELLMTGLVRLVGKERLLRSWEREMKVSSMVSNFSIPMYYFIL